MKHFSHLNTAVKIIGLYKGSQPFHLFIKDFFGQHKKYGSRDRKQITHLCYCYFRLGQTSKNKPAEESILTALFLCSDQPNELLAAVRPLWNEQVAASIEEKCALANLPYHALPVFPFQGEVSDGIDISRFNFSHLMQPGVFIRVRPGYQQTVTSKLTMAGIGYELQGLHCISLPPATKINELLLLNKEAVIQDYSSQRTGAFMQLVSTAGQVLTTWDCCAASGGKSIMATDLLGNIDLTVSDIRPSVLAHLKKRFSEAGINKYHLLATDLTKPVQPITPGQFQFIIADVPCSGSGTWGRTPERLSFFEENEIERYHLLQKKIVTAVLPSLQSGGYFLYITCSVYKKENQDIAGFIEANFSLELVKMEIIKGYTMKADSMFAALFRKK